MFGVVFIPRFSLQSVLRHEPELQSRPVTLIDPHLPKPIVVQLTDAARAAGVVEGFTPSQAMARCGELRIRARSLRQEHAARDALLQTAYAFSPHIEDTAPGVCTMELKGLDLPSDEARQQWAEKILQALAGLKLEAQYGLAITPALALIAARSANPVLTLRAAEQDFTRQLLLPLSTAQRAVPAKPDELSGHLCTTIESFPISALDPSPDLSEILTRWGIHTIGALLALGRDRVVERLGPDVAELFDRTSPDSIRPLKLVVPRQSFEEQMDFEQEIETAEPLLFILRRFVEQLAMRLEAIHLVTDELHLRLGLSSGAAHERSFKIPAPTNHIETLFRMLQTHLETVRTDAPIISLRLEARPCPPGAHQFGLFETTLKNPNQFAGTLARLVALCSADRVGTPILEATHRPDAFRMKTPEFDRPDQALGTAPASGAVRRASRRTLDERYIPIKRGVPSSFSPADEGVRQNVRGRTCSPSSSESFRPKEKARAKENSAFTDADTIHSSARGLQLRRFRPAISARIEFREERPVLLRSPVFNGVIDKARGPFRSSGDWWDRNAWSREEWDVQAANGAIYRIFRSPEGCFVEGVYD